MGRWHEFTIKKCAKAILFITKSLKDDIKLSLGDFAIVIGLNKK